MSGHYIPSEDAVRTACKKAIQDADDRAYLSKDEYRTDCPMSHQDPDAYIFHHSNYETTLPETHAVLRKIGLVPIWILRGLIGLLGVLLVVLFLRLI